MLSIIICSCNRAESLRQTLDSIQKTSNHIDFPWELIVIDNNSSDHTRNVVENFAQTSELHVKYVFESNQGLSHARNRGVYEASGEIIVFTDDDVIVGQNWLQNIWTFYQEYECDAMGGKILPFYPPNPPQWIKDHEWLLRGPLVIYDCGEGIKLLDKTMDFPAGANMSFKKTCFCSCGFFRTDLGPRTGGIVGGGGEDEEFIGRLLQNNKKVYYNGTLFVWHKVPKKRMTYRYFARWYFRAGIAMVRIYRASPYQLRTILKHLLVVILNILFDRKKFLAHWEMVFRGIGMFYEYKMSGRRKKLKLDDQVF
jgi:glycosyltransferase involved in cell wall biosynthesis